MLFKRNSKMSSTDFDEQPLLKAHPDFKIEKVGFFKVVDRKLNEKTTVFQNADIFLTAGKQYNNRSKSGFGLNHIYWKHFKEIHSRFHIVENEQIDYTKTIISFVKCFLNEKTIATEISVYHEEDNKPLILRSRLGLMVLNYNARCNYYTVTTYSKNMRQKGENIGFLASEIVEKNDSQT